MRWLNKVLVTLALLTVIGFSLGGVLVAFAYPQLPSLDVLTDYKPKVPLRVYTADGALIGEFGEERRQVVKINQVPEVLKQAILAAEDDRFYEHSGVDLFGFARAAAANLVSGGKKQGASTITMQVARNFFLSSEKTVTRKLYEVLLALKIEKNLSKDQILELYINQIYLGQRAYGFASAAQIYYGKSLDQLTPAEAAMLAGLPKAPSAYNPVVNPKRAKIRQQYVLRRMHDLKYLNDAQYEAALNEQLVVKRHANEFAVHADYVAEMARQMTNELFPQDIYTRGLTVITTLKKADQEAAYRAMRNAVQAYDKRHGYRGAEGFVDLSKLKNEDDDVDDLLSNYPDSDLLKPAVILAIDPQKIRVAVRGGDPMILTGDQIKIAQPMMSEKAPANKRLRPGAVVRVIKDDKGVWQLSQLPEVQAGFVAMAPKDGAVLALVGGFDYTLNKYNHITQAWRQPGSSFKPFIYSAALEKGFTPASVVEDSPISIGASETGSTAWSPKNYDGKYEGPMRLRTALAKSKNMVSIRILQASGVKYVQEYVTRFGFEAEKHPPYLTMALGAGSVTPWQMARAYTVFANGGYLVNPYIVQEIRDEKGTILAQAQPVIAGETAPRVIEARNAFVMDSMLRDVTIYGTAAKASAQLKRTDLAGKTGTTNEHVDAWFCGYQLTIAGCAWMGFDQPRNLGNGETGGQAALPIWIGTMETALQGVPQGTQPPPEDVVAVDVSSNRKGGTAKEYFFRGQVPSSVEPEPPDSGGKAVD